VAAFLAAWEEGLAGAGTEFMRLIRRLGLSDYNKIREVLLDAEGQPLASYMLDVFDCVLQHEIEGHRPTSLRLRNSMPSIRPSILRPTLQVPPISKIWLRDCCGRIPSD
jgi:hypothetical protein